MCVLPDDFVLASLSCLHVAFSVFVNVVLSIMLFALGCHTEPRDLFDMHIMLQRGLYR